jgi:predicted phosphodiesterase
MRVAALFDIHGNLPALEAVLRDVRESGVDRIVVGGDVVPGPMPREALSRLLNLDLPVQFIHGNCELSVLARMAVGDSGTPSYWGTVSGEPLPEREHKNIRWSAQQLGAEAQPVLAGWPKTLRLDIDGVGKVLFCHGTPRSETEVFVRTTSEARLRPLFEPLNVDLVVCGHTHMTFDRRIGRTRVMNSGSVGLPFGASGAFWTLLGPEVEPRRTDYDIARSAERIRATSYPSADWFADRIVTPPSETEILELFSTFELK